MNKEPGNSFGRINLSPQGVAITALAWTLPTITPYFIGLQILAPLPVLYYLVESGHSRGINTIAAALLATAVIAFIAGQAGGFFFTLLMLPAGISLARTVSKKHGSPLEAGFKAFLILMFSWLLWSILYGMIQPENTGLYNDIISSMDSGLLEVGKSLKNSAELAPEQALEVEATITSLRQFLPGIMPGLLLVTILNTVFLNMVAGQWLLRRKAKKLAPWPPLSEWRLPEPFVIVVILAGFSLLVPITIINTIGLNLLIVSGTLYLFQGVAILTSFLARWAVPPALRALIFVLVMIQAYGLIMLAVIGLIDVWTDLRKRRPLNEK